MTFRRDASPKVPINGPRSAGVAAPHATERDERGVAAAGGGAGSGDRQLPGAGHAHLIGIGFGDAVAAQRFARGRQHRVGDARVPAGGEDGEAGAPWGTRLAFDMGHGRRRFGRADSLAGGPRGRPSG